MNLYDTKSFAAAKQAMTENAQDLERKAGELVPVDEGILLGTGNSRVIARPGKAEIEAQVSYNTPYAEAVHERMAPEVAPSGAQMQPGPRTRAKPGNEFGQAGGGYLRRPLHGKRDRYFENVADKVKAVK
ncbi:MAG: hypothetical protein ACREJC_08090 [Tepidisphaeraceae bacterium]